MIRREGVVRGRELVVRGRELVGVLSPVSH